MYIHITFNMYPNKQNYCMSYSFYSTMYLAERKPKSARLLKQKQFKTNFTGLNIFTLNFQLCM